MTPFTLSEPDIVCRWRLANRQLPLESRHLRALRMRKTNGGQVDPALVAWAQQHMEWTLKDGSAAHPDGVLMLVLDRDGKAAMTVGEYQPLRRTSANDLLLRATNSWREAEKTSVSPEDLWIVQDESLMWATSPEFHASGSSSLIADLARTLGLPVFHDEDLLEHVTIRGFTGGEVFLVSDEHGVVPASDRSGVKAQKFAASYQKLLRRKSN